MAYLVSLPEVKLYIGDAPASADDALLTEIIANVQSVFEAETGRSPGTYVAAGTARTEYRDGNGSCHLYLDYPVVALTSVKLGFDPAVPDETLTVSDKKVIVFSSDSRRLSRTDGGKFGIAGQPRYVQVVYDYGADLPDSAKLAIKSVVAQAYRRRGSEEVKSETIGSFYSRTMIDELATLDPFWQIAVNNNRRLGVA